MSTAADDRTEAASLADDVALFGVIITEANAERLLALVGNRDLCVDALLMKERPAWLEEYVGLPK